MKDDKPNSINFIGTLNNIRDGPTNSHVSSNSLSNNKQQGTHSGIGNLGTLNNINRYQEFELKLRRRPISNDKVEDI